MSYTSDACDGLWNVINSSGFFLSWSSGDLLVPEKTIKVESISLRDFALICLLSSWNSLHWDSINSWLEEAHCLPLCLILPCLGIIFPQNFRVWWWLRIEHRLTLSDIAEIFVPCNYKYLIWKVLVMKELIRMIK